MLNWPGIHGSPSGSRAMVADSGVSRLRPRTRAGRGVSWPGSPAAMRVDVYELEPRRLQPLQHQVAEAPQQLVPQLVVDIALPAQARAVEGDRRDGLAGHGVEVPAVGREQPRPPQRVAGTQGLDDDPASLG